ncbi:uncharacterized protein LOC109797301 [Cajanus cajan]|uniref:Senescence regulator S40 n=1 Tax=Cajanus cajan TaxID=3821 RepID=A0A151TV00_CAJCA|nr:uncharacterized protein LOC109797301 [Cajanus cajan]KYP70877.1 hypothetical protein KK1_010116 [Cajanus cajan]
MASRKSFLSKVSSIFASSSTDLEPKFSEGDLELDEAEVLWNLSNSNNNTGIEAKKGLRSGKKKGKKLEGGGGRVNPLGSSSLPVNIPDWSKILKEDYNKKKESDERVVSDDDDENNDRVPPHEYLARTRGASHSVHEGRGRTLKGRDLRSVRNAIWKKMGIED